MHEQPEARVTKPSQGRGMGIRGEKRGLVRQVGRNRGGGFTTPR